MGRRGLLAVVLLGAACGTDRFPRHDDAAPVAGVEPFRKLDLAPEASNALGVQCVVYVHPAGDELGEPVLVERPGARELYYTNVTRGRIERVRAPVGTFAWSPPELVLEPREAWEGDALGGATVVPDDAGPGLTLWYAAASGAGIGRARAEDGEVFRRSPERPVLAPAERWERGAVAAPSVALDDGRFWLAYAGGGGLGLAASTDGVAFERVEASAGAPGLVLTSPGGDAWDGIAVAAPALAIERSVLGRRVLRLVYEGRGRAPYGGVDPSIGEAASFDGGEWTRFEGNPTLAEVPPLALRVPVAEAEPGAWGPPGQRTLVFVTSADGAPRRGIGWASDAPEAGIPQRN